MKEEAEKKKAAFEEMQALYEELKVEYEKFQKLTTETNKKEQVKALAKSLEDLNTRLDTKITEVKNLYDNNVVPKKRNDMVMKAGLQVSIVKRVLEMRGYKQNKARKTYGGGGGNLVKLNNDGIITKIIILLNLIIINKEAINNITKKFTKNINNSTDNDIYILLKILIFLILIDNICKYNNSIKEIINDTDKNNIINLIHLINTINLNNNDENNNIYKLSSNFSWCSKTQYISTSNIEIQDFIYESINYILNNKNQKYILEELTANEYKIIIDKKFMKDRLNDKIKKYNEDKLKIEYIRYDIIMNYFGKLYKNSKDLNEIKKILEKIETYGIDNNNINIKILKENDNDITYYENLLKIWNNEKLSEAEAEEEGAAAAAGAGAEATGAEEAEAAAVTAEEAEKVAKDEHVEEDTELVSEEMAAVAAAVAAAEMERI